MIAQSADKLFGILHWAELLYLASVPQLTYLSQWIGEKVTKQAKHTI